MENYKIVNSLEKVSTGMDFVYKGAVGFGVDKTSKSLYFSMGEKAYKVSKEGLFLADVRDVMANNPKFYIGSIICFQIKEGSSNQLVRYLTITTKVNHSPIMIFKAMSDKQEFVIYPKLLGERADGEIGTIDRVSYNVCKGKSVMVYRKEAIKKRDFQNSEEQLYLQMADSAQEIYKKYQQIQIAF